jgi:hypothetical protein
LKIEKNTKTPNIYFQTYLKKNIYVLYLYKMLEITNENFNQVIPSRLKTDKELKDDINQMSKQEHNEYMESDGERWKGPEYLIEYNDTKLNRNATRSIIRKRERAQLVGRQKWREPIGINNSKWYIPRTSSYVVSQSSDSGLKVFEPTASKQLFEQVLKQKVGDPFFVESISQSLMKNKGGKRRRTRYIRKSLRKNTRKNKTRKHK